MIEAELKDVQAKAHEAYTQEIKVLLDKAHALQAQTDKMAIEHREEEELLRKRKCKAATEVANIVEKYDKEMAAIENEIKELEFSYQTELTKCNELQEYFLKVSPLSFSCC
jgi:hypothetical protein